MLQDIIHMFVLFAILAVFLFPVLWNVIQSFTHGGVIINPTLEAILVELNFGNYLHLFNPQSPFFKFLANSLIIAGSTMIICGLLGSLAAYGLSCMTRVALRENLRIWILSFRFLPPIAIVLPLFQMMTALRLKDTHIGMILTYTAFNIPLAVWLMYSFIRDLPPQMMEAAEVDGASRLRIFWRIVLPLTKGGLMVAMLFVFIFAWNEFQFALVLTDFRASTLPKALAGLTFSLITGPDWGIIGALASLMVVPVVVAAALIHKHISRGLTFGAVKG